MGIEDHTCRSTPHPLHPILLHHKELIHPELATCYLHLLINQRETSRMSFYSENVPCTIWIMPEFV